MYDKTFRIYRKINIDYENKFFRVFSVVTVSCPEQGNYNTNKINRKIGIARSQKNVLFLYKIKFKVTILFKCG